MRDGQRGAEIESSGMCEWNAQNRIVTRALTPVSCSDINAPIFLLTASYVEKFHQHLNGPHHSSKNT